MNILITGGASGLGACITRTLAKVGNNTVYFTYSSSQEKAKGIEAEFKNTVAIWCDFSIPESVQALKQSILKWDLDILINNAFSGKFLQSHFHKTDSQDFLTNFKYDLLPVIEITQEVINSLRKKKKGKIITILTSALLSTPPIGSSIYVANKAYLQKLTQVWATENIKFNITSNTVSPSFMLTNLTAETDDRVIEQIVTNHPLKKLLTVEEVADTVLFLTTASTHINGVDIALNAGTNF